MTDPKPATKPCPGCRGTGRKQLYASPTYIECPECDLRARLEAAERDRKQLDWLSERSTQLDYDYDAEDEFDRVVYVITGPVNDREWDEAGRGGNLREAIDDAMQLDAARAPSDEGGEGESKG